MVYFSKNTTKDVKGEISKELGIPITQDLEKYLGLPTINEWVTRHFPSNLKPSTQTPSRLEGPLSLHGWTCNPNPIHNCCNSLLCHANSKTPQVAVWWSRQKWGKIFMGWYWVNQENASRLLGKNCEIQIGWRTRISYAEGN